MEENLGSVGMYIFIGAHYTNFLGVILISVHLYAFLKSQESVLTGGIALHRIVKSSSCEK